MKRLTIISILLLLAVNVLPAVQLEKIDTVTLSDGGGDDFLKAPALFAVTEDGLYLIPDRKDADIKVFDLKGKFVKRIGRKGHGPNEFINPMACDYLNRRYIVLDMGKRAYMLFGRDKRKFLKEIKTRRSIYMGKGLSLMKNDKLLLEGHITDKNGRAWQCYIYDFNSGQYEHLVPKETKYGFNSIKEYKKAHGDLSAIGTPGYCDWWGNYAYLVWLGNLKIFKINLKTKQFQTFGKKTDNYRQPAATDRLKKAYKSRDLKTWGKEMGKFSRIMGLYTNKNYLLLMYNKPKAESEKINSRMLQFYTLDGVYINELQITKNSGCSLYLSKDRDDGILYMIQWAPATDDSEEFYQMTRFKMVK
jgi:hypothetical protein